MEELEKLKRLKIGEKEFINADEKQAAALKTAAYRLKKGHFSFRRYAAGEYLVTLEAEKPMSLRGYIRAQLDKRADRYEINYPFSKVQQQISKYNIEHGTAYQTHDAGEKTIVTRNYGQECCKPLVDALNSGDPAKVLAAWQKLGYLVRGRLLQAGMGVDIQIPIEARPRDPRAAKSESAADK